VEGGTSDPGTDSGRGWYRGTSAPGELISPSRVLASMSAAASVETGGQIRALGSSRRSRVRPAAVRPSAARDNGRVINGDPLHSMTPAFLQRAVHLAVLRILALQRQEDLDRLADESEALKRRGYVLDDTDACARLAHARERAGLLRRLTAAATDLQAAKGALREAILDDAWTPADEPD
jgi:hypothetical protein